jgi:hypothetical protein
MGVFAGQICSRGPSDRVGEWLRVRIHRQKQKEEMAQWGELGTTATYGSPGCAIRGTKRPQDALVPSRRIRDYNAGTLVPVQNHTVLFALGEIPKTDQY